jgi:hypothetical protein
MIMSIRPLSHSRIRASRHAATAFFLLAVCASACGGADTASPSPVDPNEPVPVFGQASIQNNRTFFAGDGTSESCTVELNNILFPPVGTIVPLREDDSMEFTGATTLVPFEIRLNLRLLSQQAVQVQKFTFLHECGHVNDGVIGNPGPSSELAAHCWSAQRLKQERAFTPGDWEVLHQFLLQAFPTAQGRYPSGADQWAHIQACIA